MKTLTTRILHYVDEQGVMQQVSLNLVDFVDDEGTRRIGLRFDPQINKDMRLRADDVLGAIISLLGAWWIRLFIGGMKLANNIRWIDGNGNESFNCGLPARRKRPDTWVAPEIPMPEKNPGNLDVLSESTVPLADPSGVEHEGPLFVFKPERMADGRWHCGFAFGARDTAPVRYGVGDDWIHALLDAAAMLRVVYDAMIPRGWKTSEEVGLGLLPYKMGRDYFIDARE